MYLQVNYTCINTVQKVHTKMTSFHHVYSKLQSVHASTPQCTSTQLIAAVKRAFCIFYTSQI